MHTFPLTVVPPDLFHVSSLQSLGWECDLQSAYKSVMRLIAYLGLDPAAAPWKIMEAPEGFPFLVTANFARRMKKGDWNDPLLLQVLPRCEETKPAPGFSDDPVGDARACVAPGLLHKYESRALLLAAGACALHCRYCFRRAAAVGPCSSGGPDLDRVWQFLAAHPGVRELVLSGGDPLMLGNDRLRGIVGRFLGTASLHVLRIHTRMPVVLPSRIDNPLLTQLHDCAGRKRLVMVLHVNHCRELQGDCLDAVRELRTAGVVLLNQTVLLKGINDSADTLADLCASLVDIGVMPYYLHQLDRVSGAEHFEVPQERGREIMEELRKRLPGYAVPKYVKEVAGAGSKVMIG